jgi:hypothetical protein
MAHSTMLTRVRGSSDTVRALNQILAQHRSDRYETSLADIARELGVSRQAVWLLLPRWHQARVRAHTERVRRFAQRHPNARRRGDSSFMTWREIGGELALSAHLVSKLWLELGFPNIWRSPAQEVKARRALKQREHLSRVLETKTCLVCARQFPWTFLRERDRRLVGKHVVCSRSCAQKLRFRPQLLAIDNGH